MRAYDYEPSTKRAPHVAPAEHEACAKREPIHSHSHSHSQIKALTPPSQGMGISGITLRPYQAAAIQNTRAALLAGASRVICCSSTGSGKTEIGMALIKGARAKHKRVAFLCNRIHLVEQTSRRFNRAGIAHGVIQGANTTRIYEDVLIASIQTVARRGLPNVDLLLVDEAHACAGSKDFRKVIELAKCPVIGLTATPFSRGLGKHYETLGGALFERMVVAATIPELIAVAAAKGYQDGWIAHKYKERFGVWPRGLERVATEPTAEVLGFLKHLQIRHAKAYQGKGGQHARA